MQLPARIAHGDVVKARLLIQHPMESGYLQDLRGFLKPRNVIVWLTCDYGGQQVFKVEPSSGVAGNPLFEFFFRAVLALKDVVGELNVAQVRRIRELMVEFPQVRVAYLQAQPGITDATVRPLLRALQETAWALNLGETRLSSETVTWLCEEFLPASRVCYIYYDERLLTADEKSSMMDAVRHNRSEYEYEIPMDILKHIELMWYNPKVGLIQAKRSRVCPICCDAMGAGGRPARCPHCKAAWCGDCERRMHVVIMEDSHTVRLPDGNETTVRDSVRAVEKPCPFCNAPYPRRPEHAGSGVGSWLLDILDRSTDEREQRMLRMVNFPSLFEAGADAPRDSDAMRILKRVIIFLRSFPPALLGQQADERIMNALYDPSSAHRRFHVELAEAEAIVRAADAERLVRGTVDGVQRPSIRGVHSLTTSNREDNDYVVL